MNTIFIIARLTFREAVRRRIVLAALVLGLAFLVLYSIGFHFVQEQVVASIRRSPFGSPSNTATAAALGAAEFYSFVFLAGMYAVTFLSVAMAALIAADTLAGEIGTGTIQTLVTKPIRRSSVVLGKWLGFAGLLGLYLLLVAGGVVMSVWLQSGFVAPHVLNGLGLIYLESVLIMSLTLMCSSRLSTLATGGVVFGMYGLAFIGGWVEQIGALVSNFGGDRSAQALQTAQTVVNVGIVASLLMPSEALWRRAAFEMQSPLSGLVGASPFTTVSAPSVPMIVYAVLYTVVALSVAVRWFARRDL